MKHETKTNKNLILIITAFAALGAVFLSSGCATISKADCIAMDWFELGRTDGMEGLPRSTFQERAKPCLKRGVIPDRTAYYEGHDEGVTLYCTEHVGFDLGKQGLPYNPICPDALEVDFRHGYEEGLKLYCTKENGYSVGLNGKLYQNVCPPQLEIVFLKGYEQGRQLLHYRSRIKELENRLSRFSREIQNKEERLYTPGLSNEEMTLLYSEIKSLNLDHRTLSLELREATNNLEDYERFIEGQF